MGETKPTLARAARFGQCKGDRDSKEIVPAPARRKKSAVNRDTLHACGAVELHCMHASLKCCTACMHHNISISS